MPESKKNTAYQLSLAGFLITILGAVFFSTKAIFVKLAFKSTGVDAVTLLTLRMLFSLPFYLVAAWMGSKKESAIALTKREWFFLILLGIFGYYFALQRLF